jgi:hypothetical protein
LWDPVRAGNFGFFMDWHFSWFIRWLLYWEKARGPGVSDIFIDDMDGKLLNTLAC